MREQVTTWLDVAGLLLIAAGAGAASAALIGWAGLAVAGFLVLAGSMASARWGGDQ